MKPASVYKARHSRAASPRKAPPSPASRAPGYVIAINERQAPAPADRSWDLWFAGEPVTADFLNDREQPAERAGEHP